MAKLLDAELAALKGLKQLAQDHYQAAAALAARSGLRHEHGVINERLADYMMDCGDNNEAQYRYEQALEIYREWGAAAKLDQVNGKIDRLKSHPESAC